MNTKIDPRTARTQDMLKRAVLTLLENGLPLNQLSVQKITTQAALNRTTFYLHYKDINDLVEQLTTDILHEITFKMDALMEVEAIDYKKRLNQLLDYLYTQRHHLLMLFQHEQFEQHLLQLMKKLIKVRRTNSNNKNKIYVDSDIKAASIIGVIMWWIKNGLHLSSDYIADQIHLMYKS